MIKAETQNDMNEKTGINLQKALKSTILIVFLTVVFGALSYGFILLNASVLQLSLPGSLWCGLAMALAVGYYLLQRKPKDPAE